MRIKGLRLNKGGWLGIALVAIALLAAWTLVAGPLSADEGGATADAAAGSTDLPPLPWEADAAASTAVAPPVDTPAPAQPKPPPAAAADATDPDAMPPASAGTNGSYTPRPESERKRIAVATHAAEGAYSAERTALLLGDTALAPPAAPEQIQGAISAANLINDQPYRWGGGHASFQSAGYDCSGAVSYALAGGGMLGAPATSGQLMSWGVPGRGRWLTVYASPTHTYAVIAGLRWDTVGNAKGSGPRWHPADAYPRGFVARHLPGL